VPDLTLCVAYYSQPLILARQISEWEQYPAGLRIFLVDDGSPVPALPVVAEQASDALKSRLRLYRVQVDKAWHREGARNLSALKAETDWICMIDIDHVLPAAAAARLMEFEPNPNFWYRFTRYRQGKADETRMKDLIPREQEFGPVKEHIDSYLLPREMYWSVGGYDLDFIGCLGGGTDFLRRLEWHQGAPLLLPKDIVLHVYTRHVIADASVTTLSRDTKPGKVIQRRKGATHHKPTNPIRLPYEREL
jgi:Glycosyl transferase family 2